MFTLYYRKTINIKRTQFQKQYNDSFHVIILCKWFNVGILYWFVREYLKLLHFTSHTIDTLSIVKKHLCKSAYNHFKVDYYLPKFTWSHSLTCVFVFYINICSYICTFLSFLYIRLTAHLSSLSWSPISRRFPALLSVCCNNIWLPTLQCTNNV